MGKTMGNGYLTKKIGIFLQTAIVLGFMASVAGEARAYTFGFDDMVYIANTSHGRNNNGSANFAAAFPGYIPPPGYSSNGYYQVLNTKNGINWSQTNMIPTPTYIFKSPGSLTSTEYIQNDPNKPPVQGTEGQDGLSWNSSWTTAGGQNNGAFAQYLSVTSG
jgi:hypothetical protein